MAHAAGEAFLSCAESARICSRTSSIVEVRTVFRMAMTSPFRTSAFNPGEVQGGALSGCGGGHRFSVT